MVPSIFIMAAFARLSGLDVLVVIKIFSIIFLLLFFYSVVRFAQLYISKSKGSFCLLAALLFLWGTGWTGANSYMLSAIPYTALFPFGSLFFTLVVIIMFFIKIFKRLRERQLYLVLHTKRGCICKSSVNQCFFFHNKFLSAA